MRVTIDLDLARSAPGLKLGVALVEGVTVRAHDTGLWAELEAVAAKIVALCGVNQLADDPTVQAVRALYRRVGVDPTRYRPASEALLRRVLQGKGLPQVNTVVDVNNLHSLLTRLPWGVYNRAQVQGDVVYRLGWPGETYPGIGKPALDAAGKLLLADAAGVFGSPTADAERTAVTLDAHDLLWTVFAPPTASEAEVEQVLDAALERLLKFNGGRVVRREVVTGAASAP
ncbi:MAG: hypothetical protein KIT87_10870 [Anaerolineae bacterium]|nr:hypothetical protein [Anaerolineae bacterium]